MSNFPVLLKSLEAAIRQHGRRLVHLIAPVMVVASLGCEEGVPAPTDPGTASPPLRALATSTTTLAFEQVSPAGLHSCGVTVDHLAYCWGSAPTVSSAPAAANRASALSP